MAQLCFNYRNPVVYKIARMSDPELLRLSIQMLYVQAVLLSHGWPPSAGVLHLVYPLATG